MFKRTLSLTVIVCFFLSTISPYTKAHADSVLNLPAPGTMINLSPAYQPVIIKGLTIHKDNPFLFDFIVDVGQDNLSGEPLKKEGEKLIKYFLASLAIPDRDLWVNLSPYEKNRMIPDVLGRTDMGRDLLEQDYVLKQITASLIYPEKQLGKAFWNRVYAKAQQMYGTTQVPVNTFNKVWIMADKAEVFEHSQTAFVVGQHLKVMLEEDYLALQKHSPTVIPAKAGIHSLGSQIVREIILPELEKEVNTGKNFANLRQIFNSIILSSWYKKNLKEALLSQVYANKSKVNGINLNDPTIKEQIYQQYLKAYKKGVFNYIKEDVNNAGETIPRKYFSGGTVAEVTPVLDIETGNKGYQDLAQSVTGDRIMLLQTGMINAPQTAVQAVNPDAAMITPEQIRNDPFILKEGDRLLITYKEKRNQHTGNAPVLTRRARYVDHGNMSFVATLLDRSRQQPVDFSYDNNEIFPQLLGVEKEEPLRLDLTERTIARYIYGVGKRLISNENLRESSFGQTESSALLMKLSKAGIVEQPDAQQIEPWIILDQEGLREAAGLPADEAMAADQAQRAEVRADIRADVPEIFGRQTVNGRQLDVEDEIGRFTDMFGPMTKQVVSARAAFRKLVADGKAKYGWPAPYVKFKDTDGNSLTFIQIVQGLIDNAKGNKNNPNAWRLNNEVPLNPEVLEPGMQGTGPIDSLDMLMNQINAAEDGATSWMADWEDAGNDWKDKLYQAWKNYKLVFNGTIAVGAVFEHPTKKYTEEDARTGKIPEGKQVGDAKQYSIKINRDKWPIFFARIPGLHLQNRQIMLHGQPVPGFIAALIINVLNNFDSHNGRLYHYVPKIETPEEALLLAQVLTALEQTIGVQRGTLKIEMLNERARFTMNQPVIMWILRHWLIGTNVGRWDYINSLIEMHKDDPNAVFADPHTIGMTAGPLHAYTRLNAILMMLASLDEHGDMKNGMPLGGMSAFMSNGNPEVDARAVRAIGFDKMRERLTGLLEFRGRVYDGYRQSWVATVTPEYVRAGAKPLQENLEQLQAQVDLLTPDERQRLAALGLLDAQGIIAPYKLPSNLTVKDLFSDATFKELFSPIKGQITEVGLRYAIHMASEYMYQQQNGNNAAAIDDPLSGGRLMNDLATYEIFWHWLWTTVQHGAVITDDAYSNPELAKQLANFPEAQGKARISKGTVITPELIHRLIREKQESGEAIIKQNGPGRFDQTKLPMVMNLLERQIDHKKWITYGSKVLYAILEVDDKAKREKIEDAIFVPTLDQLIKQVNAGDFPPDVIEQYREVYPEYADAAMRANGKSGFVAKSLSVLVPLSIVAPSVLNFPFGPNEIVPADWRLKVVAPIQIAQSWVHGYPVGIVPLSSQWTDAISKGMVDVKTLRYLEGYATGKDLELIRNAIPGREEFERLSTKEQLDKASIAEPPGGIDLNTSNGMQWKVSKDGNGVEMNIDPAMIARIQREGIDWLSPVIFKMTPVASVWPLVGLEEPIVHHA